MNRKQAGFFAVGVLLVAVAIIAVGVGFDGSDRSPAKAPASGQSQPSGSAGGEGATAEKPTDGASGSQAKASGNNSDAAKAGESAESAPDGAPQSDANAAAAPKPAPGTGSEEAASKTAEASASAGKPESKAAVDDSGRPTFDVVRVEPDGSTLIAGHAEPNSRVDVMDGDRPIASADADEGGDFVVVLDQPLKPGNYELALKATGKKSGSKTSSEVATISVPQDKAGDLLAMVSKPGQASRLITLPKPEALPVSTSAGSVGGTAQDMAKGDASQAASKMARSEANLPVIGARPGTAATSDSRIRVEAVEIEGDSLYVAGVAPDGSRVRVYADDKTVGEARATKENRFVVNGTLPLAPGNHTIRADLLDPATGKVVERATVPFDRPEGDERFAAVAPPAQPVKPSPHVARLAAEANDALADLDAKIHAAVPSIEDIEHSRARTVASLKALAESVGSSDTIKTSAVPANGADALVRKQAATALDAIGRLPALARDSALTQQQLAAMGADLESAHAAMKPRSSNSVAASEGGPQTSVQPALMSSDSLVIIHRGDSLWNISRRVYGRGIRYTTIYLANSQQIANPNLILPGQVFDVPDTPSSTVGEAEQLHRELLRKEHRL